MILERFGRFKRSLTYQSLSHGECHYRIVGKVTVTVKQIKVFRLDIVKFKPRTCNISYYRSYHGNTSCFLFDNIMNLSLFQISQSRNKASDAQK